MKVSRVVASLGLVALVLALPAVGAATPIVYVDLPNGVAVLGANTQARDNENNPVGANYYRFFAGAGNSVDVFGDRLVGTFDMSFWIFRGLYADTTNFGASFDNSDSSFARFGDDEDAPNIAGPFGDPHESFIAPASDWYTVAVTNFLSTAGSAPPYDFQLQANVPEPGSLLLLGAGLSGLAFAVRRRRNG